MSPIYDTSVEAELLAGMRLARTAIGRGDLVVIPTDTVYGVAADAFNPGAVRKLVDAKGRTRAVPPPVLLPGIPTLDALAAEVPQEVRDLVAEFWPGGLTVILPAQPSLEWDLGDTAGTVALRMPDHRIALELMSETGPLAVSSANQHGEPAATTAQEARRRARRLDRGRARRRRQRQRRRRPSWMRPGLLVRRQAAHRARGRHLQGRDRPESWGRTRAHSLLRPRHRRSPPR